MIQAYYLAQSKPIKLASQWWCRVIGVSLVWMICTLPALADNGTAAPFFDADQPDLAPGMYFPGYNPLQEYQTQSGEPQQFDQYYQGQAALLQAELQAKAAAARQDQQLTESMAAQYQQQIDHQTHQAPATAIILPKL